MNDATKWAIALVMIAEVTWLIMVAVTMPDHDTGTRGGTICIEDDAQFYQDNLPPEAYAILYPVDGPGVMRDKNGEITAIEDLPDPGSNDQSEETPVMRWIEQSLTGQSPPVLYWPAPSLRKNITRSSDTSQPCGSKVATVSEPETIALMAAALLAMLLAIRR